MDPEGMITLEYMMELEQAAEDILSDRRQLVELDSRRQQTRQAMRELHKDKSDEKTWMCVGNMFMKMSKQQANRTLERDFSRISAEIDDIRVRLKPKVNKLRDLEHKDELRGFNLNPLSAQEMDSIQTML